MVHNKMERVRVNIKWYNSLFNLGYPDEMNDYKHF